MKRVIAGSMIIVLTVTTALAGPAQTTANVNFRTGPGSSNPSLGVLPAGTDVDLLNCDDSGSWCAVEAEGQSGFVSGKYLVSTGEDDDNNSRWPRAFGLSGDSFVVLYEPQYSSWEDFRTLDAVIAAEYRESEDADDVDGADLAETRRARWLARRRRDLDYAARGVGTVALGDVSSTGIETGFTGPPP